MTYALTDVSPAIFRAYDIRGVVDVTLTENTVYSIALAIGSEALARGEQQVVVGRDGRLSGPRLGLALIAGLRASGCGVIDIGIVPTPVLYFATQVLGAKSGVVLTGSHNPPDYNGLKIVLGGDTLSGAAITQLHRRLVTNDLSQGQGALQSTDVIEAYSARILQDVKLARPLKIVIDSGNGVTGKVAPQLFQRLGCEVIPLFCEVDGLFPNHHPDPSEPENLQDLIKAVREHQADMGLAFDGDGDRLGVVTNQGEIIYADRFLMLCAQEILKQHPGETIIFDVKCSRHLSTIIKKAGGVPLMWKTGHSFIKAKLKETGAPLAGEMSGHTFFNDRWYGFDDGLYAGARLLEILAKSPLTSAELFAQIPDSINTPELKLPLADDKKFIFMERLVEAAQFPGAAINTIDGLRVDFADSWGLIRPSNTTPYLILRFEADTDVALTRIQNQFRDLLLSLDKRLVLPF